MSAHRGRWPLLLFAVLLITATGTAAVGDGRDGGGATRGELALTGGSLLGGDVAGQGRGELQVFEGPSTTVQGEAVWIVVEEYVAVSHLFQTPAGPSWEHKHSTADQEDHPFSGATFDLVDTGPSFTGLLMATGTEDTLAVSAALEGHPLGAFKDPGLLLEETGAVAKDPDDGWGFTYVAKGDRYPMPAQQATVEGDPAIYLWDAEFRVTSQNGEQQEFRAGQEREQVAPGYERIEHTYHIVRFETATVHFTGPTVAWLEEPTLHVAGSLSSESVAGTLVHEDRSHQLADVPLDVQGVFRIDPRPLGDAIESGSGAMHLGTSGADDPYVPSQGQYGASQVALSGSDVVVAFAGMPAPERGPAIAPVVATAGLFAVIGTVLAFTPQGKWVIIGAFAPLYAKTQRDRLLESPHRERIMHAIQANPGIHLSQVRRITELGWGTTVYHLRLMERSGLITSVTRSGQRHFFVRSPRVDAVGVRDAVATIVGQETAHRIAFTILNSPGLPQREIAARAGVSDRVVAHHVKRFGKAGLVTRVRDGGRILCHPNPALGQALAILDTGETLPAPTAPAIATPTRRAVPVEG